jgi:hypothetical protein
VTENGLSRFYIDAWPHVVHRRKGQYHNERGFACIKSGAALSPIYLKTPHRIASLEFTYCIGLMVLALTQRNVRAHLEERSTKPP